MNRPVPKKISHSLRIFAMGPLFSRWNRIEESDVDERGCDSEACAHFSFPARSRIKKAIRVPRLPQNGTMIDFHEFKGVVEIRRVSDHLVNRQIWHRG